MREIHRDTLIAWLKDAHAMEMLSLPALRTRAADPRQPAEVLMRLGEHLGATVQHAERVRQALHVLGSAPPGTHDPSASLVVLTQDVTARIFSDPLVNGVIADLAAEQFEVAAYTALIAVAEHAGETEVARLCRLNRGEDEEMAEWLDAQIPIVIAVILRSVPLKRRWQRMLS